MAGLGEHPRMARMVLAAQDAGLGAAGCLVAAMLGERDSLRGNHRVGPCLACTAWLSRARPVQFTNKVFMLVTNTCFVTRHGVC